MNFKRTQLFQKTYASELIRIARADLQAAITLHLGNPGRPENIFFMAQQAIEKALKSLLCFKGLPVPLTHDLNTLLMSLPETISPPHADQIEDLTQFATIRRYEEGAFVFTAKEVATLMKVTESIVSWAEKLIQN